MSVYNEKFIRTEQAEKVTNMINRALNDIFEYAMKNGLAPEDFCFLVNNEINMMAMLYIVDRQLQNERSIYDSKINKRRNKH